MEINIKQQKHYLSALSKGDKFYHNGDEFMYSESILIGDSCSYEYTDGDSDYVSSENLLVVKKPNKYHILTTKE